MWNHRKRRLATSRDPLRHGGQFAPFYLAMLSSHCRLHLVRIPIENLKHRHCHVSTQQKEDSSKVKIPLCDRDEEYSHNVKQPIQC